MLNQATERPRLVAVVLTAALAISLLIMDQIVRLSAPRLSGNLAHVQQIPAIIATANRTPANSVLLLGNSLTNNGMDAQLISSGLGARTVLKVTPDATGLRDWQCILRHQILEKNEGGIGLVVIGTAWHLLSDQSSVDPSRLGAWFCDLEDLRNPASVGLTSPGEIGEFLAARYFRLYALRDTLRNRLLPQVIPGYKEFASAQNASGHGATSTDARYTYDTLKNLARDLGMQGIALVVVSMPVQEYYEIDPDLAAAATSGLVSILDYRSLDGIEVGSFIDSMHLGAAGRGVVSARLAGDLGEVLRRRQ
jgi:hypothetical protein